MSKATRWKSCISIKYMFFYKRMPIFLTVKNGNMNKNYEKFRVEALIHD